MGQAQIPTISHQNLDHNIIAIREQTTDCVVLQERLRKETEEHNVLRGIVNSVGDDLGIPRAEGSSIARLVDRVIAIGQYARTAAREGIRFGMRRPFAIATTHYEDLGLEALATGFAEELSAPTRAALEAHVAPYANQLAAREEHDFVPGGGN